MRYSLIFLLCITFAAPAFAKHNAYTGAVQRIARLTKISRLSAQAMLAAVALTNISCIFVNTGLVESSSANLPPFAQECADSSPLLSIPCAALAGLTMKCIETIWN